ncbi:MAG: hypothetical protein O7D86_14535 [Proteobacteria bacterium]|nr:hypothetical protein [Pseudomonadota bacterium]
MLRGSLFLFLVVFSFWCIYLVITSEFREKPNKFISIIRGDDDKASTVRLKIPLSDLITVKSANRFEEASVKFIEKYKDKLWVIPDDYKPVGIFQTRRLSPESIIVTFKQKIGELPVRGGVIKLVFASNSSDYLLPKPDDDPGASSNSRAAVKVPQEDSLLSLVHYGEILISQL